MDTENQAIDCLLFLIKDDFPKVMLHNVCKIVDAIDGVRNVFDLQVFIMIEFVSREKADNARRIGFKYTVDDQQLNHPFASMASLVAYLQRIAPDAGKGF